MSSELPNQDVLPSPLEQLSGLPVRDLEDLITHSTELSGLWELSAEGQETHQEQRELAEANAKAAASIKERLPHLLQLRERLDSATTSLHSQHSHWLAAEQEMHRAIAPFSVTGLTERLEATHQESESVSVVLRDSFIENERQNVDIAAFIREYRRQRVNARLQQYKSDALSA